uniref:glycosyltransferase n=1 Tax=Polynucleobacter sp. TaxID=2029855 RepID=UPI004047EF12
MYIENEPSVCVMLATFNGEKYLNEQILSIRSQSQSNLKIYYSDDCSTDLTIETINQYSDIVSVGTGANYGLGALNFYSLIANVPDNYDFYSFSDQDDIWLPNKLCNGVQKLESEGYDLYSSNLIAYDFFKKIKIVRRNTDQTTHDYLYQSLSAGCSYILTKKLFLEVKKVVKERGVENLRISHDWLVYGIARKHNMKCMVDEIPSLIYRQHKNNETGVNAFNMRTLVRLYKRFLNGKYKKERLLLHKILGYNEKMTKINHALILRRNKLSSLVVFILIKFGF